MNQFIKILAWNYIRIIRQTLVGRNRDFYNPESGRITKQDVHFIVEETWKNYKLLRGQVPVEKTMGSRIMVRNGVWSLSLYRAIRNKVTGKEYAIKLCTDILWKFYQRQTNIQRFVARLLNRDPQKQMNMIQRMFLRFPLAKQGYDWKIIERNDAFAYDILRCPVCDYFKTLDDEAVEFFRNSWCTLDFPLAEHLVKGGKYQRSKTLSDGDDKCDMRWMVSD